MTNYVVLEPEDWGMRWARPPFSERLLDPEIYIHHRAGNPHHTRDAATVFYEMNENAIKPKSEGGKGYSATDYDILVHENTVTDTVTIGIARGQWLSAATFDRNEEGEAICALGYFHPGHSLSEHPSPRMLEGLARACVISIERGWSARDAIILGHRDNPAHPGDTGCPGDWLYPFMDWIRARVAELLTPPEDDMAKIAIGMFEGYGNQYLMLPIASAEQARRMGMDGQQPIVFNITPAQRAALEAAQGHALTPKN